MRIDSIGIDGFGVWHAARLALEPGLTVVRGENEAGKTTLLAFIRAMLFGFDSNQYPAVAGGRRGGFLQVTTRDGRPYRIERYGERGGQGSLRVLDEDGVDRGGEHLARLLHGVEATVYRNVFAFRHEELAELKGLTEGGAAARIYGAGLGTGAASALVVENDFRAELAARFKPGGHIPTINRLLREIEDVERELARADQPAEYGAAMDELARLDAERVRLSAQVDRATSERRALERIDAAWVPAQELKAGLEALGKQPEIPAVVAGAPARHNVLAAAVRASTERVEDLSRRVASRRARLAELVVDRPLLARGADAQALLGDWSARVAEAAPRRDAQVQLQAADRELSDALRELGDGWTPQRVVGLDLSIAVRSAITGRFRDTLDGGLREVQVREAEHAAVSTVAREAAVEVAELAARLAADPRRPDEARRRRPRRWLAPAVLVVAAAVIVAAAANPVLALAIAATAAIAAVVAAAYKVRASEPGAHRDAVEERLALATERRAAADRRAADTAAALDAARASHAEARRDWAAWLVEHGYDAALDRDTALAVFDAAARARAALRRRDEAKTAADAIADRLAETSRNAEALLDELGRAGADDLEAAMAALGRDLSNAISTADETAVLERELLELESEREAVIQRRDAERTALEDLLAECGATNEAGLHELAAELERRRSLEANVERARHALTIVAGHGEPLERLMTDLAGVTDISAARERLAALRDEIDELSTARDAVLRSIGGIQGRIAQLEASDATSELRQRRTDLLARLEAEAEDWSTRRLALALMEVTRQRFEREHRPRVIRAAEELLAEWTDGRWVGIVAPLGAGIEGLERADGRRVELGGLSRGTQEQLYLALRFGLVEHFADEAEPLPIVMDETLVNFDDPRCERTARTIERMAERHQILYFTCRADAPLRTSSVIRLEPPAPASAVGADRSPAIEAVPA